MLYVNVTDNGITKYPKHKHEHTEIMFYLEGDGYMYTEEGDLPFSKGTIIIMPKGVLHGSVSKSGFKNISVGGDFDSLLMLDRPICIFDNERAEARRLAELLLESHNTDTQYRKILGDAYVLCLLQMLKTDAPTYSAVEEIVEKIKERAFDPNIRLVDILKESGYAEDYIRERFKTFIGKPPSAFLTQLRIERAKYLIEIYGCSQPLSKIAEICGYSDYIYFSKKFKEIVGISPRLYQKSNC